MQEVLHQQTEPASNATPPRLATQRLHLQGTNCLRVWRGGQNYTNVPHSSNSSCRTITDEIWYDRKCSSRTFYIDRYRGPHKIFIQELPMNIPKELSYKHQRMASSRTEHKDLKKKISTGSPKDLLTRTCARSRRDSFKGFHQDLYSFSQGIVKRSQGLKGSLRQDLQESAKMSTAPEPGQSHTRKAPRGSCEWYQNAHRATTRVIWHARSAERVARAISKFAPGDPTSTRHKVTRGLCEHMLKLFTKHCAHHGKWRKVNIEKVKSYVYICLPLFN